MTKEITGVVQEMLDKTSDKGEEYVVIRIDGEGYFDWRGFAAKSQVKPGDKVRLRVGDGKWPRIYGLEKLGDGDFEPAQTGSKTAPSARTRSRDAFIARLCCARSAALALSSARMPAAGKRKQLFHLAEETEKWVNRTPAEGEEHDSSPGEHSRAGYS